MNKKATETSNQIKAFEHYYQMDRRNFMEVSKEFHVTHTTIANWAMKFNWQERIEARAEKERQAKEDAYLADVRNRTELQKKAYQLVQGKAVGFLSSRKDEVAFESGGEAVRALDTGIKGERELMGLRSQEGQTLAPGGTTNIQNNITIALSEMAQNGQREVILRALKRIHKELNPGPTKKTD